MASNVAYLNCSAGITAELLLAALLDAGFSVESLEGALSALPIQGYELKQSVVQHNDTRGSQFEVGLSPPVLAPHSLAEIITIFQTSNLAVRVQKTALAILQHIEEAFATVSGSPAESIPLSEAESLKAIVCITGVALGLLSLNIAQVYASALPLTDGFAETAYGMQPVPAPVVLELLRRVEAPWRPSSLEGERVTILGAAILATLASFEKPALSISRVGYAFDRSLAPAHGPDLRLYIGRKHTVESSELVIGAGNGRVEDADTDWVAVVESHIDTMTGELLGGLMERLFALGALDVSYTPLQMKKNRPASLVTIICPVEQGDRFALVLLRETSTLGVRIQQVHRLKAQREQQRIDTPLGPMVVKVKRLGSRIISASPEYEECRRVAMEQDIPLADVYDIVRGAIKNVIIERQDGVER